MADHHVLIQPVRGQPPAAVDDDLDRLAPSLAGPARQALEKLAPAQPGHGPIEIDTTAEVRERGVTVAGGSGSSRPKRATAGGKSTGLNRRRRLDGHGIVSIIAATAARAPRNRGLARTEHRYAAGLPEGSGCGSGGCPGSVSIFGGGITSGSRSKPRRSAIAS